jgi:hypothetical protein
MQQAKSALAEYEIYDATTLEQAERLVVEDGISLFVVGIHFDDSRAGELIKFIRKDAKHKTTPILVLRTAASQVADYLRSTMDVMKSVQTISEYLELELEENPGPIIKEAAARCLANHSSKMASDI